MSILLASAVAASSVIAPLGAQEDPALAKAVAAISPATIRADIEFLSHDLLEGRDTGAKGYEIAREYVASRMRGMGLQPAFGASFVQDVPLLLGTTDAGSAVRIGNLDLAGADVNVAPDWSQKTPIVRGQGVFIGYGLLAKGRTDYQDADVRGRIVFMLPGVPEAWTEDPVGSLQTRLKMPQVLQRGAAGIVMLQLEGPLPPGRPIVLADGSSPSPRPLATLGTEASKKLLASWGVDPQALGRADRGDAPRPLGDVTITRARKVEPGMSWNVAGVVPGSDPSLRQETIVFTAHLDHVGVGDGDDKGDRIFNGTHDNALGIGKLLASARAMVELRPTRSIVFVAVGAEERGLLGSWHYVHNPVGRTGDIVANINHDGGLDSAPPDDVFAFGAEYSDLDRLLSDAAASTGMTLTRELRAPFSPSQGLLFRSDHYSFLARGIPAIYLMDGFTIGGDPNRGRDLWDAYLKNTNHKQRDNFNPAWTFEAPARMAALSVRLAWRIANDTTRPRIKPGSPFPTVGSH